MSTIPFMSWSILPLRLLLIEMFIIECVRRIPEVMEECLEVRVHRISIYKPFNDTFRYINIICQAEIVEKKTKKADEQRCWAHDILVLNFTILANIGIKSKKRKGVEERKMENTIKYKITLTVAA